MSQSSGHGTSSGDLNTGGNLSESSFLEALFGLELYCHRGWRLTNGS